MSGIRRTTACVLALAVALGVGCGGTQRPKSEAARKRQQEGSGATALLGATIVVVGVLGGAALASTGMGGAVIAPWPMVGGVVLGGSLIVRGGNNASPPPPIPPRERAGELALVRAEEQRIERVAATGACGAALAAAKVLDEKEPGAFDIRRDRALGWCLAAGRVGPHYPKLFADADLAHLLFARASTAATAGRCDDARRLAARRIALVGSVGSADATLSRCLVDARTLELEAEARGAAHAGRCDEVKALSGRILHRDENYFRTIFRLDATVRACLASP